jgi:hypothetical protein
MCRSLKAVLERQDNRTGRISFIDISGALTDLVQWATMAAASCTLHL